MSDEINKQDPMYWLGFVRDHCESTLGDEHVREQVLAAIDLAKEAYRTSTQDQTVCGAIFATQIAREFAHRLIHSRFEPSEFDRTDMQAAIARAEALVELFKAVRRG